MNEQPEPEMVGIAVDNAASDYEAKMKIEAAISKLIAFRPLFGLVFLYINKRETRTLPTMAVGVIRRVDIALYYNPDFVNNLTVEELKAVLIHESMHILLHHITRAAHYNYGMKGFNIAADMAINCSIPNLPNKCLYPSTFGMPDHESAEWYYKNLKEQAGEKSIQEHAEGKGDLADDHSMWGECEDEIVAEKIRGIASKAIKEQESQGWGNIAGDIVAKVMAANRPTVNWKKEVRYFISQLVQHGHHTTRSRLNRREQSTMDNRIPEMRDVYLNPGKRKDYTSRLLVATDTSGSVSDTDLRDFFGEINGMISHVQVDHVCFDTKLYLPVKPFNKKHNFIEVEGRGGTDFQEVVEFVDYHAYDGLVIMTDGFAPFPDKPRARVLWCLTKSGESVEPPWGKKVVIDIKKDR